MQTIKSWASIMLTVLIATIVIKALFGFINIVDTTVAKNRTESGDALVAYLKTQIPPLKEMRIASSECLEAAKTTPSDISMITCKAYFDMLPETIKVLAKVGKMNSLAIADGYTPAPKDVNAMNYATYQMTEVIQNIEAINGDQSFQ